MHNTDVYHCQTPTDDLIDAIIRMPKVEIHVHLEGATRAERIFAMATRNKVALPVSNIEEWKTFCEFQDFNHFIEVYLLAVACMKKPQDYMDMVIDFMGEQAAHNIQYSEVFFSAALHLQRLPEDEILHALKEGARIGEEKYGTMIAFIPDISRETCVQRDLQEKVLEFALRAKELGIGIGLGIAGKEIGYPNELYKDTFYEAHRQGLHVVAHAGETGSHEYVREAYDVLHPERIGHGIRALGDPILVEELHEAHIPLEVSPRSSYCTRVVGSGEPHPIRRMINAGLICTVNTDDPAMFSTNLDNEYLTLAAQEFTFDELWQLNLNGLEASFLDPAQKDRMRKNWKRFINGIHISA